jgi:hypothetical protein
MMAEDHSKEPLQSEVRRGARRPTNAFALSATLLIALIVNTVCLFQTVSPEAEPLTEEPQKLVQQAALESLLREGSTSEIQAAAKSQAKADFDSGNVRFEIAGDVIKRVVLNDTETELFFEGLPIGKIIDLLKSTEKLKGKDEERLQIKFRFYSVLLDKQVASLKYQNESTASADAPPMLKPAYLGDKSLAPGAVIYADAYNTRMICLVNFVEADLEAFLAEKREDAPAEKVSLLDVLLQFGSPAQIKEAAREMAVVNFNAGHPHFKMAGKNMLTFRGVPNEKFNKLEKLMHSFYAEREKQGLTENDTDLLAGEFAGGLPYGCDNPLANAGISYAMAYNERMVELLLQWARGRSK